MKVLARRVGTTTATVEPFDTLDGQGKPSYGASSEIEVRRIKSSEKAVASDGSDLRIDLMVWVDGGESPLPDTDDKVTIDGTAYIVETRDDGRDLSDALDHVKLGLVED